MTNHDWLTAMCVVYCIILISLYCNLNSKGYFVADEALSHYEKKGVLLDDMSLACVFQLLVFIYSGIQQN